MKRYLAVVVIVLSLAGSVYAQDWAEADTLSLTTSGWAVGSPADVLAELSNLSGSPSQGIEWYFNKHWPDVDVTRSLDSWQEPDSQTIAQAIYAGDGIVFVFTDGHTIGYNGVIPNLTGIWYIDTLEPPPTRMQVPEPLSIFLLGIGIFGLTIINKQWCVV